MAGDSLAVVGHATAGFDAGTPMSVPLALAALAALGQPTRLDIFRLLVRKEPTGLTAGAIAEAVGCPHNTFSTHIAILVRSGLVRGTRDGRTITYRADVDGMRRLLSFLVNDCCDGRPELCNLAGLVTAGECSTPADDCGCAPPAKTTRRKRR